MLAVMIRSAISFPVLLLALTACVRSDPFNQIDVNHVQMSVRQANLFYAVLVYTLTPICNEADRIAYQGPLGAVGGPTASNIAIFNANHDSTRFQIYNSEAGHLTFYIEVIGSNGSKRDLKYDVCVRELGNERPGMAESIKEAIQGMTMVRSVTLIQDRFTGISGMVTFNGNPVSGVAICLYGTEPDAPVIQKCTSTINGSYEFNYLGDVLYRVGVNESRDDSSYRDDLPRRVGFMRPKIGEVNSLDFVLISEQLDPGYLE